jgi:porin
MSTACSYTTRRSVKRSGRAAVSGRSALRVTLVVFFLAIASATFADDEGLAGFKHLSEPELVVPTWGPVPSSKLSIANLAPGLLPYFNNAPVFGLPGTVVGNFWQNTQLTADWGGLRTDLARHGLFIDLYSTSTYQNTLSGGLKTGDAFVQNTQLSINLDTGRMGLWPGGLLHFTVQSRTGSNPQDTFTAGSYVPQYTGFVHPGPLLSSNTYPTDYYLAQAFSKNFSAVLGKISDVFIPDQTLFGDSYKYYFANFNLNKNPMTTNFYHPTAWALLGVWTPNDWLAVGGGVLDPNSETNNFAHEAFNKVNLYLTSIVSYKIGELPGQFAPAFNWSNQPQLDFESPFGQLRLEQIPKAVGALLGGPTGNLPVNNKNQSWFLIANVSQYLFLTDDPSTISSKLKSGQVLNGIGVFGRVGYAPDNTNTVTVDGSAAFFAHGLFPARKYDSFGAGFYYNAISSDLKDDITYLTAGTASVRDEKGIEVFYDFAVTPAIRLIASYQHMWDPLVAGVATKEHAANIFLLRSTVAF